MKKEHQQTKETKLKKNSRREEREIAEHKDYYGLGLVSVLLINRVTVISVHRIA